MFRLKKIEWFIVIVVLTIMTIGIAWAIDESVTVSSTAIGLTEAKFLNNTGAMCRVEGNYIRFTMDGITTPTSAGVGIRLDVGETVFMGRDQMVLFKAVRGSATNATLKCTYYK